MKKKYRSTPIGGRGYYKYLLDQCPPTEDEEKPPPGPLIIERDGRKLIYNGHMGTFVEYKEDE